MDSSFEKEKFAPLPKKAVDELTVPKIVKNGFAICGLSPFSSESFDYNAVLGTSGLLSAKTRTKCNFTSSSSLKVLPFKELCNDRNK